MAPRRSAVKVLEKWSPKSNIVYNEEKGLFYFVIGYVNEALFHFIQLVTLVSYLILTIKPRKD
jgi:hypothetical protein